MSKISENGCRFVGLDVHAATVSVALAEAGAEGEVRSFGTIPNRPEAVRKLAKKLSAEGSWRACYEAGPTGYVLHRQLASLGIECVVVAPSLMPTKPGDRVKTDRRDALRLARSFRSGDLTPVWVPDAEHEALRDLVRARRAAKQDQRRARHRLQKFLLRHGRYPTEGIRPWTQAYMAWVKEVQFQYPAQSKTLEDYRAEVEHAGNRLERLEAHLREAVASLPEPMRSVVVALQGLRGIALLSALTIVSELGELSRFAKARQLMSFAGVVPSEHSTGTRARRGGITKTGNAHLRHIIVEAAWAYRHRPNTGPLLKMRQAKLSPEIIEVASKAQHRLHQRYRRLTGRGKSKQQVVTAVGRELLGFVWAIATKVEQQHRAKQPGR